MNIIPLLPFAIAFLIVWSLRGYSNRDNARPAAFRSPAADGNLNTATVEIDVLRSRRKVDRRWSFAPRDEVAPVAGRAREEASFDFKPVTSVQHYTESFMPGLMEGTAWSDWD